MSFLEFISENFISVMLYGIIVVLLYGVILIANDLEKLKDQMKHYG